MMSQPGKQTTAICILINIRRSKGNQTMTFGQFIEYHMRNIFLENHTQSVMQELFLTLF